MTIHQQPTCQDPKCEICLKEALDLGQRFDRETKIEGIDHLGRYCRFLSKRGIVYETIWGWFSAEALDEKNIQAYIDDWIT